MVSVPNVDSFSIAVNIGRLANLSNACGMGAYGRQPWTGGDSGPRWSSPRNFRDVAEKRRDCFFGCCQVGGKGALEDDGWEGGIRRYILALALVSLDFDYPSKGFGKLRSSRGVYLTLPLLFIFTTCLYPPTYPSLIVDMQCIYGPRGVHPWRAIPQTSSAFYLGLEVGSLSAILAGRPMGLVWELAADVGDMWEEGIVDGVFLVAGYDKLERKSHKKITKSF